MNPSTATAMLTPDRRRDAHAHELPPPVRRSGWIRRLVLRIRGTRESVNPRHPS